MEFWFGKDGMHISFSQQLWKGSSKESKWVFLSPWSFGLFVLMSPGHIFGSWIWDRLGKLRKKQLTLWFKPNIRGARGGVRHYQLIMEILPKLWRKSQCECISWCAVSCRQATGKQIVVGRSWKYDWMSSVLRTAALFRVTRTLCETSSVARTRRFQ